MENQMESHQEEQNKSFVIPQKVLCKNWYALIFVLLVCNQIFKCSSTSLDKQANHGQHQYLLALKHYPLLRNKRQLAGPPATNQQNVISAKGSNEAANLDSSSGQSNGELDQDKAPEEVLSSLKCDFGSAESPDLCKFKISDYEQQNNPLGKGLTTWALGSGKSALFQGGPLIDASQSNDTSGGYIFYETSNSYAPFVAAMPNGAANNSQSTSLNKPMIGHHHQHQQQATSHHDYNQNNAASPPNDPYSTITNFMNRRTTNSNQNQHYHQSEPDSSANFQLYSSARVSIGSNNQLGPTFSTPNLTAPGPAGMCLSFQYAIQGLSAEELRIHVFDYKTERMRHLRTSSESSGSNWTKGEILYSVNSKHSLMFSAATSNSMMSNRDPQQRRFRGYIALDEIEVNKHDPSGDSSPCRGHCNFDGDLCGWTNAESGQEDDFDWSFGRGSENLFTGPARDFTSSNNNELTGSYLFTDTGYPRRPGDRAVLMSPIFQPTPVNDAMCMRLAVHMFGNGIGSIAIKIRYLDEDSGPTTTGGGTTSTDSSGSSSQSSASAGANESIRSSSATSSNSGTQNQSNQGSGGQSVGQFGRFRDSSSGNDLGSKPNDLVIWEMSGDAGNSWHQAQTSVSSSKGPFQILIEGTVGENHLGNIAIDEISFSSGPCPTSPPVASKNYGDCTFEQSMCYWRNPDADIHLDDLDWIRMADEQSIHGPNFDHTLKRRSGSYLKLENTLREPKSGTRAFLLSPIFQPKSSGSVQCLSFYYYMFMRSISSSGPNLGTIRIYLASNNELVPIWRLTNPISSPNWKHGRASLSTAMIDGQPMAPTKLFQIAFEGIWGDASGGAIALDDITVFDGACDIMPAEAKSVPGECTFDVDMCSWTNATYDIASPMPVGSIEPADGSRSPFLQSVNNQQQSAGQGSARIALGGDSRRLISWQLAMVDARPVNLQDHTYRAPIGYAYVDVLYSGGGTSNGQQAFPLQSAEITVQSGQQLVACLSFWFAAFGRQETNQLSVFMTQASASTLPQDESTGQPVQPSRMVSAGSGGSITTAAAGGSSGSKPLASVGPNGGGGASTGGTETGETSGGESSNAWKTIDGKLLWNISLKNITEASRRKWLYGQVTLRADSNHIVRFVALSNDGGFALDDISYFDGPCETRPFQAKVQSEEDDTATNQNQPVLNGPQQQQQQRPSGTPKAR